MSHEKASCRRTCEIPPTACLRARLIIPVLTRELLLSRDREGAVLFADSAEFCKYLFSFPEPAKLDRKASRALRACDEWETVERFIVP